MQRTADHPLPFRALCGPAAMTDSEPQAKSVAPRSPPAVGVAVAALGAAAAITQIVLFRELLALFGGNELVVGLALGCWLLLSGLGSFLGQFGATPRSGRWLAPCWLLAAIVPWLQLVAARTLHDLVFIRGAAVGLAGSLFGSLALLAPYCLLVGFLLTRSVAALAGRDGKAAAGRVYAADSLGGIVGGALFSFVIAAYLDHFQTLAVAALPLLAAAVPLAGWGRPAALAAAAAAVVAAAMGLLAWPGALDRLTTARQFPGHELLFRGHSPYGRLVVTRSFGQLNFIENGLPTFSSDDLARAEEAVHYALAQRVGPGGGGGTATGRGAAALRVLVAGGSLSGTPAETLKYPAAEITFAELDPLMLTAGRRLFPGRFADPRLRVVAADARQFIRGGRARYDVVILDLPPPTTSQINRFYTGEFCAEVKRALAPGGVFAFSLAGYENVVTPELAAKLATARATVGAHFRNVLALPGRRVFFLASDGPLTAAVAGRLAAAGIATRFVTGEALRGFFAPDRFADLERALAAPARPNGDFAPILYFLHLRHWLSEFGVRRDVLAFGLATVGGLFLLGLALLRPATMAVAAAGFSGSALAVVLLLGLQVIGGAVYREIGLLFASFMAGLALGAHLGNRPLLHPGTGPAGTPLPRLLALAVGGLAVASALLPLALQGLGRWATAAAAVAGPSVGLYLLTLMVATAIGATFPLAAGIGAGPPTARAATLYAFDYAGAAAGALLASAWLIPVAGLTATCLLCALLNVAAAGRLLLRRSRTR